MKPLAVVGMFLWHGYRDRFLHNFFCFVALHSTLCCTQWGEEQGGQSKFKPFLEQQSEKSVWKSFCFVCFKLFFFLIKLYIFTAISLEQ